MDKIILFDTSVSSLNCADHYLTETCYRILCNWIPDKFFCKISTHNSLDGLATSRLNNSSYGIICGSGLLSFNKPSYDLKHQWRILENEINIPVTGMGIGFENYGIELEELAKSFYKKIFSDKLISVRGEYTKKVLENNGMNAINTGCPTLWNLFYINNIRQIKNKNVIFAVNIYRNYDYKSIYEYLVDQYDKVFLFCQHPGDVEIYKKITSNKKYLAPNNLYSLGGFALANNCDYIGARVHAGAYLLNQGIRSILIPVDLRGQEVWCDIGLPFAYNADQLDNLIDSRIKFEPAIKENNIKIWKESLK